MMKSVEIVLSLDAESVAKKLGLLDEKGNVLKGKIDDARKMVMALDAISFFDEIHNEGSIEKAAEKVKEMGVLSKSVTYATVHSFLISKQGEQPRKRNVGFAAEAPCLPEPAH